jgi:hypothetical protein
MSSRRPEETRSVYSLHNTIFAAIEEKRRLAIVKPERSVQRSSERRTAREVKNLAKMA